MRNYHRSVHVLLASVIALLLLAGPLSAATTEIVSLTADGNLPDDNCGRDISMSADGRYVAFESVADNLVTGESNFNSQIYVRDRATGALEYISQGILGVESDASSQCPSMSADGRFVAFESYATNLFPGISDGTRQVYLYDRQAGTTQCISLAPDGTPGNSKSSGPIMSANARFIVFESGSSNLVAGGSIIPQIYVRDRVAGTTQCISLASDGTPGNGPSSVLCLSADGRYVAYESESTNLLAGMLANQVYMWDRQTGTTECLSVAADGTPANDGSYHPMVSDDGRYAVFQSYATNLGSSPSGNISRIYLRDRQQNTVKCISVDHNGVLTNNWDWCPFISSTGRLVAFSSTSPNQIGFATGIHIRDTIKGTDTYMPLAYDGSTANGRSYEPCISANGRLLAFASSATNLTTLEYEGSNIEVFVHYLHTAKPLAGLTSAGTVWCSADLTSWTQVPGSLSKIAVADFNGDGQCGLVGLNPDASVWYTVDKENWNKIPGSLSQIAVGDLNGDQKDDIVGLAANNSIWYTTDKLNWKNVPGYLAQVATGDFTGSGSDGLAGLSTDGGIYYTNDLEHWNKVPGYLSKFVLGDFNHDGRDDIAGLSADNSIWYTTDELTWHKVPGYLTQLVAGDFNGDGRDDIAGLSADNSIWYTTDLQHWTKIPGHLTSILASDFNGDGIYDISGLASGNIWYTVDLQNWTQIQGSLAKMCTHR